MGRSEGRGQQNQGQGGTAVARGDQPKGIPAIRAVLEKARTRVADALPAHLTPERMIQVAMIQCYKTPKLAECEPNTILASVIRASSLGLDLESASCEAYLIPRWNSKAKVRECQFQIGFQGLRKLAMQSGKISYLATRLVYERDDFEYGFDPELRFRHRPFRGPNKGAVVEVYSHAKLVTGENLIEVMTADEVRAIEARAKAAMRRDDGSTPSGPWDTDWGEMARKTVSRRHCKSLPRSTELDKALAYDDELYAGMDPVVVHASPSRSRLGRHQHRGLAALHHRGGSDGAMAYPTMPEPEPEPAYTPGVDRPLYNEPEPPDADFDDDLPPGRLPGED